MKYLNEYLKIISEGKKIDDTKSESQMDFDDIIDAVLEEVNLEQDKVKAIKDLLYPYKTEKYKMSALKMKMETLFTNADFAQQYMNIFNELDELNIDMKKFFSLSEGFADMMEDANYDKRRGFARRMVNWFKTMDAKTIVKLADINNRMGKLIKQFTIAD